MKKSALFPYCFVSMAWKRVFTTFWRSKLGGLNLVLTSLNRGSLNHANLMKCTSKTVELHDSGVGYCTSLWKNEIFEFLLVFNFTPMCVTRITIANILMHSTIRLYEITETIKCVLDTDVSYDTSDIYCENHKMLFFHTDISSSLRHYEMQQIQPPAPYVTMHLLITN